MMALEATPANIQYIKNPTDEQINFVIEKDPKLAVHLLDKLSDEQILTIIANNNDIFSSFLTENIKRFNIDFFKKCLEKITDLYSFDASLKIPYDFLYLIIDKMIKSKDKDNIYKYDGKISQLILGNVNEGSRVINNLPDDLRYILLCSNPSAIYQFSEIKVKDIEAIINYVKDDKYISNDIDINENVKSLSDEVINKLIDLVKIMKKHQNKQDMSKLKIKTFIKYLNIKQLIAFADIELKFITKIIYELENNGNDELLFLFINEIFTRHNEREISKIFKPYEFEMLYIDVIYSNKDKINPNVYEMFVLHLINIIPQIHSRSDTWKILRMLGDLTYPQQKKLINSDLEYAKYIKNLDSRLQMKMIEKNPFYIKYINNPTPDVVKLAYEKNPETKEYIR